MEFGFLKEYARRGENPRRAFSVECCMASAFSMGKWVYIKYNDNVSVGDKIVFYSANKGTIKYIIPKADEPYTSFRPNEKIDSFMSLSSISGRMTCSIPIFAATSKLMVELDRSIKDLAGIPYDESKL